jgi:hypothetical protein
MIAATEVIEPFERLKEQIKETISADNVVTSMWKSLGILLQSLCDNEIENLWI